MIITELSLTEYYKKIVPRAKEMNYKWVISLIARHADAKITYQNIEQDWASIHDLTNSDILFVFSIGEKFENNSFYRTSGNACYVGTMCPYAEVINGENIIDTTGDFRYYVSNFSKVDWKQKHTQSITEFMKHYNIPEEDLPCLFVWNLKHDTKKYLSLKNISDLYNLLRKNIIQKNQYEREKLALEQRIPSYKNVEKYFGLYNEIIKKADESEENEKNEILSVLYEKAEYKKQKDKILNKKNRIALKKIGQWKRQFFEDEQDYCETKNKYQNILEQKKELDVKIDQIWDEVNSGTQVSDNDTNRIIDKFCILRDIIWACNKLQANATNYNTKENKRNDYIRDLLDARKYDVNDQTRYGISPKGKDAGEIDIMIKKDNNPIVIIEALNLSHLNKSYINSHIDKIFIYDVLGNKFNVIINYVTVAKFEQFCKKYIALISQHKYLYPLTRVDAQNCDIDIPYSDIKMIKTVHKRNGKETMLYHICLLVK